ncbi:MAG: DUF1343 domain-containing protein [Chitinophagales bacterium]
MKHGLLLLFALWQLLLGAQIQPAAHRTELYFPLLKNKKVALLVNQTATIGRVHLVDSLQRAGINVVRIFAPEHGFRGTADAGAHIADGTDKKTGIPIVSLYGKKQQPSADDLRGIDILVFDIQDVGCRFYTFLSTLHYVLQACADNQLPLMVLDRPNPNGDYFDGPMLDTAFRSFVGVAPVPVVHGLTLAEYATMARGEGWIAGAASLQLTTICCKNYTHRKRYWLPVPPSPNLRNGRAVEWYPSLCFFEGTNVSVARGTDFPFQAVGSPVMTVDSPFTFTPTSKPGAVDPPFKNRRCYGFDLRQKVASARPRQLNLEILLQCYAAFGKKDSFFLPNHFFDKLAGTDQLRKQVLAGVSAQEIRNSWKKDLEKYGLLRRKYLLYVE